MKKSQSGSAHVIIVAILAVALIGAVGFIFWQNFIQKKSDTQNAATASKEDTTKKATESAQKDTTKEVADPNKGYVVLADWGVRFKTNSELNGTMVRWKKASTEIYTSSTDHYTQELYYFTTDRLTAANPACTTDGSVAVLYRTDKGIDVDGMGTSTILNNYPHAINGYYYISSYPSAGWVCGDNPDAHGILDSLKSIEAVPSN